MSSPVTAIVDAASALSPQEQGELLVRLLEAYDRSADDATPAEIEAAWLAEIGRRLAADARGEVAWTAAEDLFAKLRRA